MALVRGSTAPACLLLAAITMLAIATIRLTIDIKSAKTARLSVMVMAALPSSRSNAASAATALAAWRYRDDVNAVVDWIGDCLGLSTSSKWVVGAGRGC